MIRIVGLRRLNSPISRSYSYPRARAYFGERSNQKSYVKKLEKEDIDKEIIQSVWNPEVGNSTS